MKHAINIHRLRGRCPDAYIMPDAPMSDYTTMRVGGAADALVAPAHIEELTVMLRFAKDEGVPITIIGNGSNLLVRDGGIPGLVICIAGKHMGKTPLTSAVNSACSLVSSDIHGNKLYIGAGVPLSAAAQLAADHGLSGMEALCGIPGTIGGATVMNAGAYDGEISRVVKAVNVIDRNFEEQTLAGEALGFRYRGSAMMDNNYIITHAQFELTPDDPALITARMADYTKRRKEKQPLVRHSAGSFFKRPAGHFAGALIENAGLKGFSVGGAMVSPMHAGFIVNTGGATASDILHLKDEVIRRVFEHSGVTLEPEVRIIGVDI